MQFLRNQYLLISLILSISLLACQGPETDPLPPQATALPVMSPSPSIAPTASASARPTPQTTPQPTPTPFPLPTQSPHPLTVVAGSGEEGSQDGPALQASFNQIIEICLDPTDESLYILEQHKIRKLTPEGQIITVAGTEQAGFQDGPALQAKFNTPRSCAVDERGRLYIADANNHRIRVLEAGVVKTLLGNDERGYVDGDPSQARLSLPQALALDGEKLYIGDWDRLRVWDQNQLQTLNGAGDPLDKMNRGSGEYIGLLNGELGFFEITDIALTKEGGILLSQSGQGLVYILPNNETYIFKFNYPDYASQVRINYPNKSYEEQLKISHSYLMVLVFGIEVIPDTDMILGTGLTKVSRLFLQTESQKEASGNSVELVSKLYGQSIGDIYSALLAKQDGTVYVATSKPNQILKFQVKLD